MKKAPRFTAFQALPAVALAGTDQRKGQKFPTPALNQKQINKQLHSFRGNTQIVTKIFF